MSFTHVISKLAWMPRIASGAFDQERAFEEKETKERFSSEEFVCQGCESLIGTIEGLDSHPIFKDVLININIHG